MQHPCGDRGLLRNRQHKEGVRSSHGVIKAGEDADLQIIDAPMGSAGNDAKAAIEAGDVPGIAMVIIDGAVKTQVSRNTPPPVRKTVQSA